MEERAKVILLVDHHVLPFQLCPEMLSAALYMVITQTVQTKMDQS